MVNITMLMKMVHTKKLCHYCKWSIALLRQRWRLTSSSTHSFTPGTTNIVDGFSINNRAYDSSEASFELINGYLTADSWYRPVSIIKDGVTWQASTAEDFRPLLMAWWPNVDTQVNYLNYMSKVFNLEAKYTSTDKQADLNRAAKDIKIKIDKRFRLKNQHNGCVKLSLPLLRHNHMEQRN
ncbi:MAG: glycoside hydrolase family 70 protein [Streptococcus salivarius]